MSPDPNYYRKLLNSIPLPYDHVSSARLAVSPRMVEARIQALRAALATIDDERVRTLSKHDRCHARFTGADADVAKSYAQAKTHRCTLDTWRGGRPE